MNKAFNPELLRNWWLEMTPQRLVGMPLALVGVFALEYMVINENALETVRVTAIFLYFVLTVFWGTRLAGEAIINEVRDRTWNTQRMTAIDPWSMTWGKLFGSTVFSWYGAVICLLVYAAIDVRNSGLTTLKIVLASLTVAVFYQAVAMLVSMFAIERKATRKRAVSTAFTVIGLLLLWPFLNLIFRDSVSDTWEIQWFGSSWQPLDFALWSLLAFSAWSIVGLYRKMRVELQFQSRPLVWIAFNVFCVGYGAGLLDTLPFENVQSYTARLYVAFFTVLALSYIALFIETKNLVAIRRLLVALQARQLPIALQNTSAWMASIPVLLLLLLLAVMNVQEQEFIADVLIGHTYSGKLLVVALFVFLLRDMALVIFLHLGAKAQRADATAIVYLLMLYWLVPSLAAAMGLPMVVAIFVPLAPESPVITIGSGIVQLVALGSFIVRRWRRAFPELQSGVSAGQAPQID